VYTELLIVTEVHVPYWVQIKGQPL